MSACVSILKIIVIAKHNSQLADADITNLSLYSLFGQILPHTVFKHSS